MRRLRSEIKAISHSQVSQLPVDSWIRKTGVCHPDPFPASRREAFPEKGLATRDYATGYP